MYLIYMEINVEQDRLLFNIEKMLKRQFKDRIETTTKATMSNVFRGCIFYMLSLSQQELRDFIRRCEDLEWQYYENIGAQGDLKAQIMEDRGKITDALKVAFDEGLIDYDFKKDATKPGSMKRITEAYTLLMEYRSRKITKEEFDKRFKDIKSKLNEAKSEEK